MKFDGEQHVPLTPGEYTQLTGRAGRRGIDVEGHAVVLWNPDVDPAEVAGLASTRTFPLRSSFAPSYNMTINLVNQMGPTQAHKLLERSFAQYQADRSVVGLVRGIERGERMLDEIAAELGGRDAPILDYVRLRAADLRAGDGRSRGRRGCSGARPPTTRWRRCAAATSSPSPTGRRGGLAVVLEPARDSDDPRPLVLTEHRWAGRISSADYSGASAHGGLDDVAQAGRAPQPAGAPRPGVGAAVGGRRDWTSRRPRASEAARRRSTTSIPNWPGCASSCARIRAHGLPDREEKARLAERYLRIERDNEQIQQKVAAATNSLARTFDRIVVLLTERGFIRRQATATRGSPTTAGCWPGSTAKATCWSPSACAAARGRGWTPRSWRRCCRRCSTSPAATRPARRDGRRRSDRQAAPRAGPDPPVVDRAAGRRAAAPHHPEPRARRRLRRRHLPLGHHRRPGRRARRVRRIGHAGSPLSAGDFVRWCRQVLDLADQVRNAAPTPALRAAAKRAINDIRRGVVAVDAG